MAHNLCCDSYRVYNMTYLLLYYIYSSQHNYLIKAQVKATCFGLKIHRQVKLRTMKFFKIWPRAFGIADGSQFMLWFLPFKSYSVFILPRNPKYANPARSIFDTGLVIRDIFNSLRASEMCEMGQCLRKKTSSGLSYSGGLFSANISCFNASSCLIILLTLT